MSYLRTTTAPGCDCEASDCGDGSVSIDEALARIGVRTSPVDGSERVGFDGALGRVLAEPVLALSDMPRFDHAAMDGYALRTRDLAGPGPWRLPVRGRIAAGAAPPGRLAPGSAARIFTGAPMPAGADSVAMQERVVRDGNEILLGARPAPGGNIRFRGEENPEGGEILSSGTRVGPRHIAAAAAGGHATALVRRRLRVTVIVTGVEVAAAGTPDLGPSAIWDVNSPMLRAALSRADVDLLGHRVTGDDPCETADALARASRLSDLIVTTGGISVGEEDHLRNAARSLGATLAFSGVAMKPGKPVTFGRIGAALWLGLPGNPQSAFVAWTLFGEAILQGLSGADDGAGRRCAVLSHLLHLAAARREVRAASLVGLDPLGRERVDCSHSIHSGRVGPLCRADGLCLLPAVAESLPEGSLVEFLPFPNARGRQ